MSEFWTGKTAVISGGSRGLGLHLAMELARQQSHLVLIGRDADNLRLQRDRLLQAGAMTVDSFACDAAEIDLQSGFRERLERSGVDLLVNAIGVSDRGMLDQLTREDLLNQFNTNVLVGWSVTKSCLVPVTQNQGCIVNIGSLAGLIGTPNMGGYCVTKFAWTALTRQWRMELKERGVHVLLVAPGPIARDDSDHRYDALLAQRGIQQKGASKPGGGAKLRRIDPVWLSQRILVAAAKRERELIVPWKARIVIGLFAFAPGLAEYLLRRSLHRD
ncbi:3-oxoacyl-[acyl-carrier-protein] reductase FabG [Pirellula sp. SH-Sr6A]|uniref:SDR family NAD(P)-dependent oxidoreductase n=1 Tax=Pirellula sp. SH-Sr6A TaxID=1632865 RepID=UPI00078DDB09|nr:SDR family NAD(P)-dependent oxidoreductase [Pirellula sp. SH-Sr6A]AMV35540.1 3-oxoacyl-[acyl-carrier-protein] reductase FabG [Pirellula sp. SH-Sr6A]